MLGKPVPMTRLGLGFLLVPFVAACSSTGNAGRPSDAGADSTKKDGSPSDGSVTDHQMVDELPPDIDALPPPGTFCSLPGSVVFTPNGPEVVQGSDASTPSLAWLHLPVGFCAHYFGTSQMARQLRFAPDGHLFVASPSMGTTGGSNNGTNAIVVMPDDNHDGVADSNVTFLSGLPATQGLMFTGGYFYFQDLSTIKRVPFNNGDLSPSAAVELVTTVTVPQDSLHWTKVLDIAQDGTIYITNGGSQSDTCISTNPVRGSILKLLPGGVTQVVAKGFRNPIAMRCEPNHDVCLAAELSLDYSGPQGGREKILQVHQGDDWGFPCCASQNIPYTGVTYSDTHQTPDCSGVQKESAGFIIGETPFGLDFETGAGKWPAPWGGRVFVTLHGVFGSWTGARVVGIALDPATGIPLPSDDLDGGNSPNMADFATGWDDGTLSHGRPASITFAPDGRMFIGDDQQGAVIWIAPVPLKQ